jgi:Glyoxalase-like domain
MSESRKANDDRTSLSQVSVSVGDPPKADSTALFRQQRSSAETIESLRGRLHQVILDCPDPRGLRRFYSALVNHPITCASDDYVVVAASNTTSGLAFQLAPDHRAPTWPDTSVPQQMHLDIMARMSPTRRLTCLVSARPSSTAKACLLIRPGIHSASSRVPAGLRPSRTDRHAHWLIAHPSRLIRSFLCQLPTVPVATVYGYVLAEVLSSGWR